MSTEYYLWGAGTYGGRLIEFMRNDLTFKAVIDSDPLKQGKDFHGLPVLSYDEARNEMPEAKIVISLVQPYEIRKFLLSEGFAENQDFYLIMDFLPIFYKAKGKLVSFHANLIATTKCTLKCEACQTYIPRAKNHVNRSAAEMIKDIDLMFSYVDSFLTINFACGESLLNIELPEVCRYIYENYSDRYLNVGIVTNGTIIPSDDVMRVLSESKVILSISEYVEHKITRKRLIEKCKEFSVNWFENTSCDQGNWYDFGDPNKISMTNPDNLKNRFTECWIPCACIYDGWLYLCAVQAWSHAVVGAGTREPGDAFDLTLPKTEKNSKDAYRILSRQPELGYISHCMRCNGTIPILECKGK